MATKANKTHTIKVCQIEKNPILALGMTDKDVERYGRVAKAYGNVAPAIVGQGLNGYRILAGQAVLTACVQNGIKEIPAIVAETAGDTEQMKLSLLLSTVREEGGALAEGTLIETLTTQHGVTRRELMSLLGKSKSWISKRQSLAMKLTDDVKDMVRGGSISARTAEEIAKLPQGAQVPFACKAVTDGLSKTHAERLVSLYMAEDAGEALREAILTTPLTVLDAAADSRVSRHKEKRGPAERIAGTAGFIIRMACELKGLIATADNEIIIALTQDLGALRSALVDLHTTLELRITFPRGNFERGIYGDRH